MKLYRFHDNNGSVWLRKYNDVISKAEEGHLYEGKDDEHMTLHHIIPRSVDVSLKDDKMNHVYLSFYDHAMMHYWMWKHDRKYARQLWFIAVYGRKNRLWDFPEGEQEYEQLKNDLHK